MMSDDFIEGVITPKTEREEATMNREFYGMMAVQAENYNEEAEEGGDE